MSDYFKDKSIVVTGAGKGIGEAIALKLANLGAEVIAAGRSEKDLQNLCLKTGGRAAVCDISRPAEISDFWRTAGKIYGLVNCAGISVLQPFQEVTADVFDQMMAVNVRGSLLMAQSAAKNMIDAGITGSIVNISSQGSMAALKDHTCYCATKGALDAFTRVAALELGEFGIRVNSVNPTVTMTAMGRMAWGDPKKSGPMLEKIPLRRFAEPEDVADSVAFLLSDESKMITGVSLPVDGGFLIQ